MNQLSQPIPNDSISSASRHSGRIETACSNKDTKIETCSDNSEKEKISKAYLPKDTDVIVGRGKKCYNHAGNQNLRRIVASKLDEYSATSCKVDKSCILASIVAQVRTSGGFIKEDPETGKWHDVGDVLAREKISQTFRDALHEKYKSSTTFKRKRRQEKRAVKATFNHYSGNLSQHSLMGLSSRYLYSTGGRTYPQHRMAHTSSLSQSLPILDFESASSEPIDLVERLSNSLPDNRTMIQNSSLSQSMTLLDLESASDDPFDLDDMFPSSAVRNHINPVQQHSSLSQSLTLLDLETSSDEPIDLVDRLSDSLPNLYFESEDPNEPIPISHALSMSEESTFGTIPKHSSGVGDFDQIIENPAEGDYFETTQIDDFERECNSLSLMHNDAGKRDALCFAPIQIQSRIGATGCFDSYTICENRFARSA